MKEYTYAKDYYAALGVDSDAAMKKLDSIAVSIHCWQTDDVLGFEGGGSLSGGISTTGDHIGRARNAEEVRADLDKALSYIPGENKINIHAIYLEGDADRDAIEPRHFSAWADWAAERGIGLDFNPTFFSHEKSENGYTLACRDDRVREFWVEHGIRSRKVAEYLASRTGKKCVNNIWVPDGEKEFPIDTASPRERLKDSLDKILDADCGKNHVCAVESKLFGIGSEGYVAGSHEFYMGYALSRKDAVLTLDTGHFHPTEMVSAKISALLVYLDKLLLHVSRPMRWDSDHVVSFDDETRTIFREIARLDAWRDIYIATDYFDASINRVMALAIGARNTKKAMLESLLQPVETLKKYEREGDNSRRLALSEELKTAPLGIVWDEYCESRGVMKSDWVEDAARYENEVTSKRI